MKKTALFLMLLSFTTFIFAQNKYPTEDELTPGPKPQGRPSVALVLAGGGAKGFAELPIMELIQEMDIPIDMIIGTSIGSIIGGLYSAGYSVEEIVTEFGSTDWTPLFSDAAVSPFEHILGEHSVFENPLVINFNTKFKMHLGKGLSSGQNVYQLFKEKTIKYPSDMNFDDFPIPFRAVATNMLTGDAVILDKGDIAEAMRASMSLPAVFSPFEMDGYYFMDGGLRYNLAINVAKKMGYDYIIAIDISQPVRDNPEVFDSNPAVAILNTMTIAQQTATKQMIKDADLVIKPDVANYATLDFKKAKTIFKEGQAAAEKYKPQIEEFRRKLFPDDYTPDGKRISKHQEKKKNAESAYSAKKTIILDSIRINGALSQDEKYITEAFNEIKGKAYSISAMQDFMRHLYSLGNYSSIRPKIIRAEDGNCRMDLYLTEIYPKGIKILVSPELEQTVSSSSITTFNLAAEIQARGLTGRNSVIGLRGKCLNDYEAELFYMQPFNPYVYVEASAEYYDDRFYSLSSEGMSKSDFSRYETWNATANAGFRFGHGRTLKAGGFYTWSRNSWASIKNDPFLNEYVAKSPDTAKDSTISGSCFGPFLSFTFNAIDRTTFAHEGIHIESSTKLVFPQKKPENMSVVSDLHFTGAIPLGEKASVNVNLLAGTDFTERLAEDAALYLSQGFFTGDRMFFPQLPARKRHGQEVLAATLALQLEPWDSITILGGKVILRIQGTAGNLTKTWGQMFAPEGNDAKDYRLLWNGCLGIGIKLKENFNFMIRGGAGSTEETEVAPFLAIDIGGFRF